MQGMGRQVYGVYLHILELSWVYQLLNPLWFSNVLHIEFSDDSWPILALDEVER